MRDLLGTRGGVEELLTRDDLVGLMRRLCEAHAPFAEWWLCPQAIEDLVTNEHGWCELGWATASKRHSFDVWVHWERRIGRLVPAKAYG